MAVTTIEVSELAMFVLAIVAILVGTAVNGRVASLRTSGIPPAVTGGLLFALYLLLAGSERFLVEFIRRNGDVAIGLTQAQLISLAMIVPGGLWLLLASRRTPRPAPSQPSAAS